MQCGLCAVVAGLFRRAMCIAGSRRGSGESSSYQELPPATNVECASDNAQRPAAEIMLDYSAEQNTLMQQISEEAKILSKLSSLSDVEEKDLFDEENCKFDEIEKLLLAKFDISQCRPKHTGRFLTMHKRRRKRLITRSLDQDPGLLDDIFHGQVQCVLQKVTNWKFNAFTLETVTGGRSLPVLCVHLFHWYGLLDYFQLDVVRVWKLFTLIEEGYHSTNPYHNSIHAADVTQAMHCFLQENQIKTHLSYLEIMASLIAAVTHDLDHPGVNQPFLVATSNHLAALYENTSVLENHHWRSAIGCLLESGVSEQLPDAIKPDLQRYISSLILATDITRQQEFLTRFKHYLDNRELDMKEPEHRHFILQIALKCADISNPCRPWDISRKWAYKVCEEFFRQGDYERQLNLPVTSLCDRHSTSIPKIQEGFFVYVVLPLYEEWHRFLNDEFSTSLMRYLHANQRHWKNLLQEEIAAAAAATMQPISPGRDSQANSHTDSVTVIEQPSHEAVSECTEEDSGSSLELAAMPGGLAPPAPNDARRHSVPLGVSRSLSLAPRATTTRRESLPSSGKHSLMPSRVSSRSSLHRGSAAGLTGGMTTLSSFPSPTSSVSERPVSAENLLPDTSIASIANSLEASKLSSLVQRQTWDNQLIEQSNSARQQATLTRQQTFPPVQPYARVRYMSTTAEMSQCCTEVLFEADSSSSRSVSPAEALICSISPTSSLTTPSSSVAVPVPHGTVVTSGTGELRRHSTPAQSKTRNISGGIGGSRGAPGVPNTGRRFTTIPLTQELQTRDNNKVFFIGSPPDSPPRLASATPSSDSGSGGNSGGGDASGTAGGNATDAGGSTSGGGTGGMEPKKSADSLSLPGNKRDYSDSIKDKSSKMMKLMKENVDPRASDEFNKSSYLPSRRSNNQSWARRRGSAPVGLLSIRVDDTAIPLNRTIDHSCRRGSVPADITTHPNGGINRISLSVRADKMSINQRRSSLPQETTLFCNITHFPADRENYNNNNNNNGGSNNNGLSRPNMEGGGLNITSNAILSSRRGSVPADISELRRNINNGANGKSRINRSSSKKLLRRRSSGGPEMFASGHSVPPADGNDNSTWSSSRSKREFSKRDSSSINEPLPSMAKRRGSLPIEMLALSLTGRYIHR